MRKTGLALFTLFFIFNGTAFAQETYRRCSPELIQKTMQQLNIDNTNQNEIFPSYSSCLMLNPKQRLLAVSIPTKIDQDQNYAEYALNLYLIDSIHQKLLKKLTYAKSIISDADVFEDMKFDINPYSKNHDQHLVGLAIHHGHLGGFSYSKRSLYLLQIQSNHSIKLVLEDFMTNFTGHDRSTACENAASSTEYSRTLTPINTLNYGLNQFKIIERSNLTETDPNTCKTRKTQKRQQHQIKFNGIKYPSNNIKFLDYGI